MHNNLFKLVLKGTAILTASGVFSRFLVGREVDPGNSEVARLIKQSLEQDQFHAEMRLNQMMSDQNRGSSMDDSDMDEVR